MAQILVVDDEVDFREGVVETLEDLGQRAEAVGSVKEALAKLETKRFDAVFIDFRMPDINGIEGIKLIKERSGRHDIAVVMITAFVDAANTIAAMKLGAFDHLTKPVSRADIERILGELEKSYPRETRKAATKASLQEDSLIGNSPEMREILKLIGRLAATDSSVLITGETGTGKELVAKAIHSNSQRASAPFVAVNCAAIPESLLESELFGHVKGAYTGAATERKGSFQTADHGSLLLDEIGDMDLSLQAKLLRSLQERTVTPVGSSVPREVDVRFIAATHRDIAAIVETKEFREDLYYRLNVVEIHLPPLRERRGDLPVLIDHFLSSSAKTLSPEARKKLDDYRWPGNIRELRNVIERATVIARGPVTSADDIRFLSGSAKENVEGPLDLPSAVANLERSLISRALHEAQGNRSEAARKLGIQRQLLYTKMKDYLIDV